MNGDANLEPKVNVLLATYNGEKYVRQQLDSLLAQTYKNLDIYVLDDCSQDSTRDILEEYREKGIQIVPNERNLGYPCSFFKLMQVVTDAKYYCFCDQDDVWLPEKVEWAIEKLKVLDQTKANLYFADFDYCDEQLSLIRESTKVPDNISFEQVLFQSYLWGFTVVFNETARLMMIQNFPKIYKGKDYWVQLLCKSFGTLVYENKVCAKYRRHGKNVSEDELHPLKFQIWRFKHFWINNKFKEYHGMLAEFYDYYSDKLSPDKREILNLFQSKGKRFKKAFFPKRLRSTWFDEIMLRIIFLLGKL